MRLRFDACFGAPVGRDFATTPNPQAVVVAWFASIKFKDKATTPAAFAPTSESTSSRSASEPSAWPTFSDLHCRPLTQTATNAPVYCTFNESQAPSVGNPAGLWAVSWQRSAGTGWLITNCGQG